MHKLLILSFSVLFSIGLYAQNTVFSGSDNKLEYNVKVESLNDEVNDNFYQYYSLEIKNISTSEVIFTPVFNYETDKGVSKSSLSHDEYEAIKLAPGQTIKGFIGKDHQFSNISLTLFKSFLVGNSGKKANDAVYTLNSISINY